jgi:hypothetical protein
VIEVYPNKNPQINVGKNQKINLMIPISALKGNAIRMLGIFAHHGRFLNSSQSIPNRNSNID